MQFDPPPEPPSIEDDPRWTAIYENWLGGEYAHRLTWPIESFDDAALDLDRVLDTFVTECSSGPGFDIRPLTADECWQRHQLLLGAPAVVLAVPRAMEWFDPAIGRVEDFDARTMLSWVGRPTRDGVRLLALERGGRTALLLHHGSDDEGNLLLTRIRPADEPVLDQLAALGVADGWAGEPEAVLPERSVLDLAAFMVVPVPDATTPTPDDDPPPPRPRPDDLPADIYSSLFIALADDRHGAPLEAVWHMNWEMGGVNWLLTNADRDVEDVSRIPYRQRLPRATFLDAISRGLDAMPAAGRVATFVEFRRGRGHCITVSTVDDERVHYFDPWPGRSLLAVHNNDLGIAARREDASWKHWSVTHEEFLAVAYAATLNAETWLTVCGVERLRSYPEVVGEDLFTFFHLHERARTAQGENVEVEVRPQHWSEEIGLTFRLDPQERILRARLEIDRAWLTDPATAPFGFDLLKSFVHQVVVEADRDEAEPVVEALWKIWHGGADALQAGPSHLLGQSRALIAAIVGRTDFGRMTLPCTTIKARNMGEEWTPRIGRLQLTISASSTERGPLLDDVHTGYLMDGYRAYYARTMWRELERRGRINAMLAFEMPAED